MTQGLPGPIPPVPPPAPPAQYSPPPWWVQPPRKSVVGRFFRMVLALLFVLSVLLNVNLLMLVIRAPGGLSTTVMEEGAKDQVVAVYTVQSVIGSQAAAGFHRFYQAVRDEKDIKAVVLRIESPGGGMAASDEIHQMVQSIRKDLGRPVVVSMGGIAASGGYYIAAPADEIYAEPTTITGSIGVLAEWPVVKGLLDKVGVEFLTIRSTHAEKWKAKEFNPFETPDPAVMKRIQDLLDTMQARFEEIVQDGRKAALAKAKAEAGFPQKGFSPDEPLTGKTYTAQDALAIGLVDQIGYLPQAVQAAAKRAGISSPRVVQYAPRGGLLDALLSAEAPAGKGVSIRLDADGLEGLASPRILMIWKP